MAMEEKGRPGEASRLFLQAWKEAENDFEKFTAAYYVARHQTNTAGRLRWLETALGFALKLNDEAVRGAFPSLYASIAKCYGDLGDLINSKKNYELARSISARPSDNGPFYHGTRADLKTGDLLTPGLRSNYAPEMTMNHIFLFVL